MVPGMGDVTGFERSRDLAVGVADRLPLLINRLGYEMAGRAEPGFVAVGLTGKSYMALAILDADQPRSQLEVARLVGCAPALVVSIADELEAAGFVERRRDPADRRRSVLAVTPAGRRALAKGDRVAREVEEELLAHIPADERERLHAALRAALEPSPVPMG